MILTYIGVLTYYLSYLVFLFLAYIIWQYQNFNKSLAIILIITSFLFIYARFIEPNFIKIKERKIKLNKENFKPFKIAVFSDLHIGLFTKRCLLKKVIKKINKLKPNFVVIPGDLTWYLPEEKIEKNFKILKNISCPIFITLGNHDCGNPLEKDVSKKLIEVLLKYGVKVIDNKIEEIEINEQKIKIIGLSDLETRKPNYSLIKNFSRNNINIVVSHNPEIAYEFPSYNMDLVICGHTHGGQVRIYPFYKYAYKYITRMKYDFDKGLREFKGTRIFITTGLGMAGLPFRFLMPPVIDILEFK